MRETLVRIFIKTIIVGAIFILGFIIKDKISQYKFLKEWRQTYCTDTISPVTRECEKYDVTKDSVFIKRLEQKTKELLK